MKIPTLAPLGLAIALAPAMVSGAGAQVREIDPNGLYPAGTRLSSPLTGIAFQLPEGFRAEWDPSMGGLVAMSTPGVFGGVWGWSEGTIEDVASEVGQRLEAQGILVQPRGEQELTANGMRGVFDARTEDGVGVLYAAIGTGPSGGVVGIVGLADTASAARAETFVERVVGSLEWSRPGAAVWRQEVTGAVLTWGGGGSDLSAGTTTATGASSSSATLALCGVTEYRYQESSESYVSLPGASASSTSSDEHTGQWWLVADLAGTPTLFLDAADGRTFQWSVEESGDGFLIDGYRYTVTGQC